MLFRLPADLAHFKETTIGGVMVMGHKTLLSLPGSKPLPKRDSIVLSRNPQLIIEGAKVSDLQGLPLVLAPYKKEGRPIFIIGGEEIYRLLLPYTSEALVTKVATSSGAADTFFPNLDKLSQWVLAEESDPITDGDHTIRYTRYTNNAVEEFR